MQSYDNSHSASAVVEIIGDLNLHHRVMPMWSVDGSVFMKRTRRQSLPWQLLEVTGDLQIDDNCLTSLWGCPERVGEDFSCTGNRLDSLEYGPKTVGGNYFCDGNVLRSLDFCPQRLTGSLFCESNQLSSLSGTPAYLEALYCSNNPISSLIGVSGIIRRCVEMEFSQCPIESGGLGLLLISGLKNIDAQEAGAFSEVVKILNKYLGKGSPGFYSCRQELIQAGYANYALI
jgi:hypothetical protein